MYISHEEQDPLQINEVSATALFIFFRKHFFEHLKIGLFKKLLKVLKRANHVGCEKTHLLPKNVFLNVQCLKLYVQ